MECKNCNDSLRTDYSYCPACGAKVIRNRLTVKNLWYDFTERFFNLDNTFIVTFKHLFTKPDVVNIGYITGVRKKYMNPVSYFMIAVFLGGIFFFLNKKFFPGAMDYQFSMFGLGATNPDESQKFTIGIMKKYQDFVQEYQSFVYMATLPLITLISRIVFFNKKQYNLSEHFVINMYAYAQTSIIVNTLYILSIWNSKLLFWESSFVSIFLISYFSYIYKKTFKLTGKQILLKLLLFLVFAGVIYIGIIIILGIYLALFTDTFANMKPAAQAMLFY